MKTRTYILSKTGGVEALTLSETELKDPQKGEVQLKHKSIGINFIDIYHRTGLYPLSLPTSLGLEGIGEIIKVGSEVRNFQEGDWVGYAINALGAYQEARNLSSEVLFPIKKELADKVAGTLLRGLTAEYLINRLGAGLKAGDTVLLHAAAGGVGLIALQWLKNLGIKVIATSGSEKKRQIIREHRADLVLDHKDSDLVGKIKEFTGGEGVKIIYDSIGKNTFASSLDSLARRGLLVSYGNSSGPVEPFSPLLLAQKGSLLLTRPTLADYYTNSSEILTYAPMYLELVEKKVIKNEHSTRFSFENLLDAQEYLETGKSIGATWVGVD